MSAEDEPHEDPAVSVSLINRSSMAGVQGVRQQRVRTVRRQISWHAPCWRHVPRDGCPRVRGCFLGLA